MEIDMNTPIIITVPNNYLVDEESQVVDTPPPSRKRRLDHLTWEEKMQRKKLKNRVAAQTSRDRKKAKMDEMEARIQHFMDINERLVKEVEELKAQNERLLGENATLRGAAARSVAGAPGPAESHPQQKEGPPQAVHAARLLLTMCLLSQTCSPTSTPLSTSTPSATLQTLYSEKFAQILKQDSKRSQVVRLEAALREKLKWWGPHQSNWNPVKVKT